MAGFCALVLAGAAHRLPGGVSPMWTCLDFLKIASVPAPAPPCCEGLRNVTRDSLVCL
ncbi:hypothetical protein ACP4OV_031763 [Aristida adscensionis]